MTELNLTRLSKAMAHALRHAPERYGLTLDPAGWAEVDALLTALRARHPAWHELTRADLRRAIAAADKQRFEMNDSRIRALYGHTTAQRIEKRPSPPPERLFHGTAAHTVGRIQREGLCPMARHYVHLSEDAATAHEVGQRHSKEVVILVVRAGEAYRAGVCFYHGNQSTWLADAVPPEFIDFPAD